MMAQQEVNNKIMEELKNRPIPVQTEGPAQPVYACPNCIPRRLPPDMQDPNFRCPTCLPRDPGFGENLPRSSTKFYDVSGSPVKTDAQDTKDSSGPKGPKPTVQFAGSGSDSREEASDKKKKSKPKGRKMTYQEPENNPEP